MNQELINSIADYVEKNIGEFHKARIAKLQSINLKELLSRKNPYMYKAKNIVTAGQMVESLASAYMSSAEESIFGNWMEGIASFVAEKVYDGHKSAAEGIDLEFDKEGVHYFVSVKSGPSWSNSTSMKKQKEQFRTAVRVFNTSRKPVPTMCIEGCCYKPKACSYHVYRRMLLWQRQQRIYRQYSREILWREILDFDFW